MLEASTRRRDVSKQTVSACARCCQVHATCTLHWRALRAGGYLLSMS
jgi:hypothetical protein